MTVNRPWFNGDGFYTTVEVKKIERNIESEALSIDVGRLILWKYYLVNQMI